MDTFGQTTWQTRFMGVSKVGAVFAICAAFAFFPNAPLLLCQQTNTDLQQTPAQESPSSGADFEFKIVPGAGVLVRRKGTSEWTDSKKLSEPVLVGLLDGQSKIYAPSKAIKPPKAKRTQPPNYPENERKARDSGQVVLHIIVDDHGVVRLPTVDESPSPEFARASIDAVQKWSFEPARLNGQPVAVLIMVQMQFHL